MKDIKEKIISVLKYFFATSNRFCISSLAIIWAIYTLISKGWYYLICILWDLFLILTGAVIFACIQLIIYIILKSIWSENEIDSKTDYFFNAIPYIIFANFSCIMFVYCKGTVTWH